MLQYPASQLHLLARCRKEFAINLGVNFCQILIRSLITINQEATTINRNDVHTFLRLKLLYDRSCDTNIRATGFSRSRCRIVVIDVDVFCIRTIIIKMMLLTISTLLVPSLHIIDRLIITQKANTNRLYILSTLNSFYNFHFLINLIFYRQQD